jgi:hypothetical protein
MKITFDFKGSIFGQKEKVILDLPDKCTVLEALKAVSIHLPLVEPLLFKDDKIRGDIVIFVDRIDVKAMKLFTLPLEEKQKITILPLAHGG